MLSDEPAGVVVWYVFVEILEENLPLLHLAGHVFPLEIEVITLPRRRSAPRWIAPVLETTGFGGEGEM